MKSETPCVKSLGGDVERGERGEEGSMTQATILIPMVRNHQKLNKNIVKLLLTIKYMSTRSPLVCQSSTFGSRTLKKLSTHGFVKKLT